MGSFIIKDNNISFADISTIINKDLKLSKLFMRAI